MAKKSAVAQGKALEKRTQAWLESHGWMVHTVHSPPAIQRTVGDKTFFMASSNQDLFGLWDHAAVRKPNTIDIIEAGLDAVSQPSNALDFLIWGCINILESAKYDHFPSCIFVQTKSRKQYGKDTDKYKDFPYKWKFLFVWEKGSNGRYGEPLIQILD